MLDLLTVGDVMLDVIAGAMPTGAVHADVRVRGGGSALNAAVWAASEGAAAAVIGRIGNDPSGAMVRHELEKAGAQSLLMVDPELPTGTVVYARDGVVADRGATRRLCPADLPDELAARTVLISGYALLHADTEAAARAAIERARADWIAVDAASSSLVASVGAERFFALTEGVTVLLANEEEARALTGLDAVAAARSLGRRYRLACVKRGALGAVAACGGELHECAPPHVLEQDAAGSGDAFVAGLLVALARGKPVLSALAAAVRLGTAAAAG
jgi:sugar/nucleoside kinase (ribokinase family)